MKLTINYTKVLTIYVGDAYDWYLVDPELTIKEGFVGVNNTLNLYLKQYRKTDCNSI